MLLGLAAVMAMLAMATIYWLRQRRAGTIMAVSIPMRRVPSADRQETAQQHH